MHKFFYSATLILIMVTAVMMVFGTRLEFTMDWTEKVANLIPFVGIGAGLVARFSKNPFEN